MFIRQKSPPDVFRESLLISDSMSSRVFLGYRFLLDQNRFILPEQKTTGDIPPFCRACWAMKECKICDNLLLVIVTTYWYLLWRLTTFKAMRHEKSNFPDSQLVLLNMLERMNLWISWVFSHNVKETEDLGTFEYSGYTRQTLDMVNADSFFLYHA